MNCPSELTLAIFADGESPSGQARQIADHVEGCARCAASLSALEQENLALREALSEAHDAQPAHDSSLSLWLWGGIAICAITPATLAVTARAMPSLPSGLGWITDLGGVGGLWAVARHLFNLFLGGQDMWLSMFGFAATLAVAFSALVLPVLRRPTSLQMGMTVGLIFGLVVAAPVAGTAAEYRVAEDQTVRIAADESLADTVILSGKTALIEGVVDGDVFVAGERVEISGQVLGDVYGAGENVRLTGVVRGNVHLAGADVVLDGTIEGTAIAAGQHVTLGETGELRRGGFLAGDSVRISGQVARDLHFAGDTVVISGAIGQSARGFAGQVSLASTARVGGDFTATVPAEDRVEIDEGATVGGETEIKTAPKDDTHPLARPALYFGVLARTVALLIVGFLFITLFPALKPRLPETNHEILRHMGVGFLTLVATPVAAVLALITVIGIPVAFIVGATFGVLVYLSPLVVAFFIARKVLPAESRHVALTTAGIVLASLLVFELPLVGPGMCFLVCVLGAGCLVLHLKALYLETQATQEIPG